MLRKTLKMISLVVTVATIAMAVSLVSTTPCMAASKKPKLAERVEVKYYDKTEKKWLASAQFDFTYNKKGDPVRIEWASYRGYGSYTKTLTYTYRANGKRKYAKYKQTGVEWGSLNGSYKYYTKKGTVYYDKRGRMTKDKCSYSSHFENGSNAGKWKDTEKYKYKKGGFYLPADEHKMEKTRIRNWKKGLLRKISLKSRTGGKWRLRHRFNKRGLVKKKTSNYRTKYTYNKKTGLVKSAKQKCYGVGNYKYIFTYNNKSISKTRYAAMINSFMDGQFMYY